MDEGGNHKATIKHLELNGNENSPNKNFQDTAREVPREKMLTFNVYIRKKKEKINDLSIQLKKLKQVEKVLKFRENKG